MKSITNYLNKIINYDWDKFNQIKDMFKQAKKWNNLLDEFDQILVENSYFVLENTDKIIEEIRLYESNFQSLNIKGKLHIVVERFRITGNLIDKLNNFKFQNIMTEGSCNCLIRKKLNLTPKPETIKQIRTDFDGYYYSRVYRCNECKEIWILEELDDGTARWQH
ncbi:hypothetical protein PQ459_12925 [Chryseobacterium sp. KACC 21268]|nr:hypothetical protein PQ459_12925 [Chryseobacterium sp. KACC 21268]